MLKHALLSLILVGSLTLKSAQAAPYSNYSLSGTEYFSLFDYSDISKHERMKSFEKELVAHADKIVAYLAEHPDYEENRSKYETSAQDLGMILVYTAMFTLNINNAVLEGKMEAKNFEGLGERYEKSKAYMELAQKLAPNDERIPSWAVANELRRQKVTTGKVDDVVLDQIIGLVKKNPIFHLFNALTMTSDYNFGPEREAVILQYTELMDSKESPCWPPIKFLRRGEAKQCNTTKKTPFAFQGVSVYMGDEFLKTALNLAEINPEKSKEYAKKAMMDYKRLDFFLFKKKTNRWGQKDKLHERISLTQKFMDTGYFDRKWFESRNFLDIYTCTSCHQNGIAPTKLFVNLR